MAIARTADKRGAPKSIRFKHIQTVEKAECEPPTIATLGQRPSFCCSNCMPALESATSELTTLDYRSGHEMLRGGTETGES